MKAIRAHRHGGPEVLQLDELATPSPAAGQVLVAVELAGVNFIDTYHRSGLYKTALPVPIGREGAGTILECGPGVGLASGTRVAWSGIPGSYATHLVAPADRLVPVPDSLDAAQAAALMLQGITAQYLTRTTYPLRAGATCLIHAAAGGVGRLLCQLAHLAGARVIGTVSTEEKAAAARAAGAGEIIRYDQTDFAAEVHRITGGAGVEVVYDGVGAATFQGSLDSLAVRGMLVLFGQSSGVVPPIDPAALAARSLFLTRPALHHYTRDRAELVARASEVLGLAAEGKLTVAIDRVLPLEQAAEAHRLLEGRATSGKVLLRP
ncbi:MAG TPA: quinone oxidoreductase [Kofleriaceae bacterium]|nr:quinone oxidoreductase [Kofleriaceae bacterium]